MNVGTATAGYGFEYVVSTMDRVKAAALSQNDAALQMPIMTPIASETYNVKEAVVSEEDLEETISTEIEIAFMAGIPFIRRYMNGKLYLQPTKGLNLNELEVGAPQDVINFLNQYSY